MNKHREKNYIIYNQIKLCKQTYKVFFKYMSICIHYDSYYICTYMLNYRRL